MLIKLTDRCTMMCAHCMEDARPDGNGFISDEVFHRAVTFGQEIGCRVFTLSGGEPTEHPRFRELCTWLDGRLRGWGMFTICSNGMWLKDEKKTEAVRAVSRLSTFTGMQVYTNRKWYREYDYVMEHRKEYEAIQGIIFTPDDKIWMQDLGRARNNAEAQKEVAESPYFMSCLNATLIAKQCSVMRGFGQMFELRGQFCRPQVDCEGNVHMSESRLCPSVGSVLLQTPEEIYSHMRRYSPCGNCAGYRRFCNSMRPDILAARLIIGDNSVK